MSLAHETEARSKQPVEKSLRLGNTLIDRLHESGAISIDAAKSAIEHEKQTGNESAESYLIDNRLIRSESISVVLAKMFNVPYKDASVVENFVLAEEWANANGGLRELIENKSVLPIAYQGKVVGCIISNNRKGFTAAYDFLKRLNVSSGHAGDKIALMATDPRGVRKFVHSALTSEASTSEMLVRFEKEMRDLVESTLDDKAQRIFKLLREEAFKVGASDIHVEPESDNTRIRFRIDGELSQAASLPIKEANTMCAHILTLAERDSKQNVPVDGKVQVEYRVGTETEIRELRIAYRQASRVGRDGKSHEEAHMSIRVLNHESMIPKLINLGYSKSQSDTLKYIMSMPKGCVFVTGPTGEGKTTTMASMLDVRRGPSTRIMTAEDPIEIRMPMVNQHEVNQHFTFLDALRYFVRCDPDILMIGEIRDFDSMTQSVQAALTGHLLLASLHTNDAVTTLDRLEALGKKGDETMSIRVILDAVNGIVAQRLLRKVCPDCCKEEVFSEFLKSNEDLLLEYGHIDHWFRADDKMPIASPGKHCKTCKGEGFLGRTSLAEILSMSNELREFLLRERVSHLVARKAISLGFSTFHHEAKKKILVGTLDLKSVVRKLGPFPEYHEVGGTYERL